MRIESLQYFVVTANCKSMTLSSKVLHVSQQCISKEIKQLEDELGVFLFVRSNSGVALTKSGEKAYQAALQILQQIEDFSDLFTAKTLPQTLTIGSYIGFKRHIEAIATIFQRKHPNILVDEYYYSTEQLEHALNEATLDIVLRQVEKGMPFLEDTPYKHFILLEEPLQILVNDTTANAHLKCFAMEDFKDYPFLVYCDNSTETPLYQRIAQRYGPLKICYKGNNIERTLDVFERKNAVFMITKSLNSLPPYDLATKVLPIKQEIAISTVLYVKKDLICLKPVADLKEIFQIFFDQFI